MSDIKVGDNFAELEVLSDFVRVKNKHGSYKAYECLCSCGVIKLVRGWELTSGHSTSCGHRRSAGPITELVGTRHGILYIESIGSKTGMLKIVCDCGNKKDVKASHIRGGFTRSCGCLSNNHGNITRHGFNGTPTYLSWSAMKSRCDNPNATNYAYYGGRGITYDARWRSFENFLEDMGARPPHTSIGRIDNDGHYTKLNCEWQTSHEQSRNKSNTVNIEIDGVVMCKEDWLNLLGIGENNASEERIRAECKVLNEVLNDT